MKTSKVHAISFSPAMSTKKVVKAVASGVSKDIIYHDVTMGLVNPIEIDDEDFAVIGVPSYSGRVPELALKYFSEIKAKNVRALLVCVYGNRDYDDTLVELWDYTKTIGFIPISAGAFLARHSIVPIIGEGRPNEKDLVEAYDFGKKSVSYELSTKNIDLKLKGNRPYRQRNKAPLFPVSTDECSQCGRCARECPVGAIDPNNHNITDENLCISCARCIELCPHGARQFQGDLYDGFKEKFITNFSKPLKNETFFPVDID